MRGAHVDPPLVGSIYPAPENAPAREDQRMRAIVRDDGELEIAIEGCGRDRMPHAPSMPGLGTASLI
jgi:hypothetical protein